ncbi:MAG: PAS domain S-box protein, partial [Chloroflexota bacterium]|nr:PAS domain S-box protein [Chloroflexota bacterium]
VLTAWNRGAEEMYGWKADEVLGRKAGEVLQSPLSADQRAIVLRDLAAKGWYQLEVQTKHRDGTPIDVEGLTVALRDTNQQTIGYMSVNRDIRDRKAAEEALRASAARYRALADAMPQIVYTATPNGNDDFMNQQWYIYTGISVEDGLGLDWALQLHPDDRQPTVARWQAAVRTGLTYETEYRIRRADGEYRWQLSRAIPVRNEAGQIAQWIGTSTDIHERKAIEEALQVLNEQLEQRVAERTEELMRRNQELDQFSYIASHDLKSPLRAIDHLADWIVEDAGALLPATSKTHLDKLQGRIRRMEGLLDDLLAYSRADRYQYPSEPVATATMVADILQLLDVPAGFTVSVQTPMPTLTTVRVPLELVFRNLIGNAIKHHNRADGVIQISAIDLGDRIEFGVADDGPGIEPQFHERIFQMFQTLKPRDQVEGSGMGLAVVKKTVENRGGMIWVEARAGRGTVFRFTWPK